MGEEDPLSFFDDFEIGEIEMCETYIQSQLHKTNISTNEQLKLLEEEKKKNEQTLENIKHQAELMRAKSEQLTAYHKKLSDAESTMRHNMKQAQDHINTMKRETAKVVTEQTKKIAELQNTLKLLQLENEVLKKQLLAKTN